LGKFIKPLGYLFILKATIWIKGFPNLDDRNLFWNNPSVNPAHNEPQIIEGARQLKRNSITSTNSLDSLLNDSTGLAGLAVPGLSYFFKVSSAPDFENKIPPTVESGFEP